MRIFVLPLVVTLTVAACGGDPDATTSASSGKQETTGGTGTSGSSSSGSSSSSSTSSTSSSGASGTTDAAASEEFSGEATYYDADGTGACGFKTSNASDIAAINDEQYTKAHCGECAAVKGPNGTVVVKIADKCPGCKMGDLDLSEQAFGKIAKLSAGRVKITWHFTACP